MTMRPARVRCSGRGRSGARRRIEWRWLLGLALLSVAIGCGHTAGLRPLPVEVTENPSHWLEVDSLQPTLRWEAFPRPEDLKADKAGRLATVRKPTYELRIWRAEDYFPAELVYARSGLAEPVHTVETVLAPNTRYLWTIRARFELNGEPRVTEWGAWGDGRGTTIPLYPLYSRVHYSYYEFRTPQR